MATGFGFEVEGLEELERDLTEAVRKCPVQAEKTLLKVAKKFKKSAKQRAETELQPHEREGEQQGKAISDKWGHKKAGDNLGMAVLVYNSARHFHLVENGHNLVKNGKTIGFVPGKHIMEKTRNEYKDIVTEEFQKMADDILKEGGLD